MRKSFRKFTRLLNLVCVSSFIFVNGHYINASEINVYSNIQGDVCNNKISEIEPLRKSGEGNIKIKHLKNILNRCTEILEFNKIPKQKDLNEQFDVLTKIKEKLQIEYSNCPWYKVFKLLDIRKNIKLNDSKIKLLETEIYNNKKDIKKLKQIIKHFEQSIDAISGI